MCHHYTTYCQICEYMFLIQLADIIVGSINRSFQADKTDSEDYIRIIRKKIVELKLLNLGGK